MNKNELRYASGVLLATRDGRYEQPFPAVFVVASDDVAEGWRFKLAPSRRFVGRYAVVMADWLARTP